MGWGAKLNWDNYKAKILANTDFKAFYENEFRETDIQNITPYEMRVKCCFHDDQKPSMSINIENGMYYCHGCKAKGNIFSFIMEKYNKTYIETCDVLGTALGLEKPKSLKPERPPIDISLPNKYHRQLMEKAAIARKVVQEKCGWSDEVLVNYQIGWNAEFQRVTIPIYDEYGVLVNIRMYKWDAKKLQDKMISYSVKDEAENVHLYGEARIYGIEDLFNDEKYIIWCAGEKDRIQLKQQGFNACTVTSGEGIFKAEWIPLFKNKIVYICLDNDETGRTASITVADKLYKIANTHIVELPAEVGNKGDISDYFVNLGHTPDEFKELLKSTPRYKDETVIEENEKEIYSVHLSKASNAEYTGKKVKIPVLISGKDASPYIVPKKVKVLCGLAEGKKCQSCHMASSAGEFEYEFLNSNIKIVEMLECSTESQAKTIRDIVGVADGCRSVDIKVLEYMNIEEVRLIPQADSSQGELNATEYVTRRSYFIGSKIESNQRYEIIGYTYPDPKTQYAIHLFDTAIPAQDTISSFEVTDEMVKEFEIFRPKENQSIEEKFKEIHKDLERNVTKIWGRFIPAAAIDLIYHTSLSFYFQNQFVKKGWAELLILGDSGQGKSTLLEKLMSHYKMGELTNGESAGRTGLVYNLQETQKKWFLSWGKIPLNDQRLLAIDEFSGVSEDDIALMSDVRSSGTVKVTKVISAETDARTRLIFLSNPRNGRQLNTFNNGIEAVSSLFGKNEDVRRLDIVVAVASGDIDNSLINKRLDSFTEVQHVYTSELCKNLVLWAWSRKPNNIIFGAGTEDRILEQAIKMGKEYSSKIPLVEGADQRLKIARLSIAAAIRLFSSPNGQDVLVLPEHVDFVVKLMTTSYDHKNLSYNIFSKQAQKDTEFDKVEMTRLTNEFGAFTEANELAELLLEYRYFRKADLQTQMDYDKDEINKLIKWMTRNRIIETTPSGFRKKATGIQFLRYVRENPVDAFDPNSEDSPF